MPKVLHIVTGIAIPKTNGETSFTVAHVLDPETGKEAFMEHGMPIQAIADHFAVAKPFPGAAP